MRGLEDPQEVELTVDGERILTAAFGGDQDLNRAADQSDRHVGQHRSDSPARA
jgi:hypothetical protein